MLRDESSLGSYGKRGGLIASVLAADYRVYSDLKTQKSRARPADKCPPPSATLSVVSLFPNDRAGSASGDLPEPTPREPNETQGARGPSDPRPIRAGCRSTSSSQAPTQIPLSGLEPPQPARAAARHRRRRLPHRNSSRVPPKHPWPATTNPANLLVHAYCITPSE